MIEDPCSSALWARRALMRACQRSSITRSLTGAERLGGGPPFRSHDDTVAGWNPRWSAICLIVQPAARSAFTFMYSSWVIIGAAPPARQVLASTDRLGALDHRPVDARPGGARPQLRPRFDERQTRGSVSAATHARDRGALGQVPPRPNGPSGRTSPRGSAVMGCRWPGPPPTPGRHTGGGQGA